MGAAGSLALSVYPVATDWAGSLTAQTVGPSGEIGAKAGASFSKAFAATSTTGGASASAAIATQAQLSADAVSKASQGVVAARAREETAAGNVKIAEQQLAEARVKYGADSSQVVAAEEKLSTATRNVGVAAGNTELASTKLTRARQAEADASKLTSAATDVETSSLGKWKTIASESNSTIGGLISQYGKLGALVGVAVVVGIGVKAVQAAANFQTSQERLVTSAGEVQSSLTMVSNGVLNLAGQVGYSAQALSTAMYTIESGGQHGAAALDTLKASAQGAATEGANLTTVADAVTSAMTDYADKGYTAAEVTSKLVAATGQGKTTFENLSGAMSAILPKASGAGIGLNEILGDMASMTLHGISAEQSAQNLANTIGNFEKPSSVMIKELGALGLNSTSLSQNLGKEGLSGTLNQVADAIQKQMGPQSTAVVLNLQNALKGLPPTVQALAQKVIEGNASWSDWNAQTKALNVTQRAQSQSFATLYTGMHQIGSEQMSGAQVMQTYSGAMGKAVGGAAALNVSLMLTGKNTGNTTTAINAVSKATGDAQGNVSGWSEVQATLNQRLNEAKDGIGAMVISLGTKLLPAVTGVVNGFMGMVNWLIQNRVWVGLLASMVGGLVVGMIALKVASLASAAATWIMATAQKAAALGSILMTDGVAGLNAVMDANIFVIIALAIVALVAGVIYAYTHFKTFRDIVADIANFFKTVFLAVFHAVGDVIDWLVGHWRIFAAVLAIAFLPVTIGVGLLVLLITHLRQVGDVFAAVGEAIAIGAKAIAGAFVWLWNVVLHPIFNVIMDIVVVVAKILIALLVVPVVLAIQALGKIFVWLYNVAIKPIFDQIAIAARVVAAIFKGAFDLIGDAVSFVYDHTLLVIWHALQTDWLILESALNYFYGNVVKPIWTFIGAIFQGIYLTIIKPIWQDLKTDWVILQSAFSYFYNNVIHPIWQAVSDLISTIYHDKIQPIWSAFKSALADLESAFHVAVSGIQTAWTVIEKVFGTPIEFVIRTVLNDGFIRGINTLLKVVGISGLSPIPDPNLPTFATGGYVPGFGTGDTVHALLTPGEGVLTASATQALGGAAGIQALNAALGGSGGGPTMLAGMPAFSLGGLVSGILGGIGNLASSAWNAVSNVVEGGLRDGATAFFNDIVKPLVNLIPNSPDGSPGVAKQAVIGFVTTLENDMLTFFGAKDASAPKGGAPYTGAVGKGVAQWTPLVDQALAALGQPISWEATVLRRMNQESGGNPNAINLTDSNAKAGDPSRGLMQTIQTTFNAYKPAGAAPGDIYNPYDNIYAGMNYAIHRYGSLAGMNRPGGYDNGGWLPPGVSTVANLTGRAEPVFSPSQWDTLRANTGSTSGGSNHYYNITSTDPMSVAYELERREAAHMRAKL